MRNCKKQTDRKAKQYIFAVCILAAAFVLYGCTRLVPVNPPEESTETNSSAAVSEEETSEAPSDSTAASFEETGSSETEKTVEEIPDSTDSETAYRCFLSILTEERENILRWTQEEQEDGSFPGTALCDISGSALPELLYITLSGEEGQTNPETVLHAVSVQYGETKEILRLSLSESEKKSSCFFTIEGDRRLYEYSESEGDLLAETWYYYEEQADGTLSREELVTRQSGKDPENQDVRYYYRGTECGADSYEGIAQPLLDRMENILLYFPAGLFEDGLKDASGAADFGMTADDAISFLRSEISFSDTSSGKLSDLLYDYIIGERYLISGAKYYTEPGNAEITFGLYDMNGDGGQELLISNGSGSLTDRTVHVYEFTDGAFFYRGDAGFRECRLFISPGSPFCGVFCTGGDSGFIMDIYYEMREDGSITSEMVASYEDTSYKIESHDEQRVTDNLQLYQTWAEARPSAGKEAVYVPMQTADWIRENGIEAFMAETQE